MSLRAHPSLQWARRLMVCYRIAMSDKTIGVAISTTGDEHRLGFLETCVAAWRKALPLGSVIVVTVDGTEAAAARAAHAVMGFAEVYRVGQRRWSVDPYDGKQGVAVNKNTGIELLMAQGIEHLFLSDDDSWPLTYEAIEQHLDFGPPHSMVCWGNGRIERVDSQGAVWKWPRGVLLYARRSVIERVGGMVESFGLGGHEHAEWSNRIHQAGMTPEPFITPAAYGFPDGGLSMGARRFWHCEDMPGVSEPRLEFQKRKKGNTTIHRTSEDWVRIDRVMRRQRGSSGFVPYEAEQNGRVSATLCTTHTTGQENKK